jgi:antitoxin (DNA-binding transcriptional repressor) of toxin-antitoxin stability system
MCSTSGKTKTVTLTDASEDFARYIREVEAGEDVVITRDGSPVARISLMSTPRGADR